MTSKSSTVYVVDSQSHSAAGDSVVKYGVTHQLKRHSEQAVLNHGTSTTDEALLTSDVTCEVCDLESHTVRGWLH